MNNILIIEDEKSVSDVVKAYLEREGYGVYSTENGLDGIEVFRKERIDLVILDLMLPGIDGFKVCEVLRKEFPSMGIIMLTAKGQDMDKIMGLEYGADDYVVKPFNPIELTLRVKSLLRRIGKDEEKNESITSGEFVIDLYSQKVYKNQVEIDLTPKEYMMLKIFMENPGKAFSRDELLNIVWDYNFFGDSKIVDVNIRRLRSKVEDNPSEPKYIETVWGTGYRWKA